MSMAVWIALHTLAVVVWVGGMFFAYMALRPVAAALLEPPLRLPLWARTFAKFFPWVWVSVALLLVTGYVMLFQRFGGFATSPLYVHLMQGIGLAMMAIFLHVFFAPYGRLKRAVAAQDWPAGGKALGQIRLLIGINLILGLATTAIAVGGRYI
jgi:uncharacterized membrane protein